MTTWAEEMPPLTDDELKKRGIDPEMVRLHDPYSYRKEPNEKENRKYQKRFAEPHPFFSGTHKKKIFIASFNRASDGALMKLKEVLESKEMLSDFPDRAEYILAPGDREETFEFCLDWYRKIPIIHLWAGDVSQGTHDEVFRWSITLMSYMQLCTNQESADRVVEYCRVIEKEPRVHVVGNVMIDNMPELKYDVVLYNPPTLLSEKEINEELDYINSIRAATVFWIPPNGDEKSELIEPYVNARGLSRNQFLNLVVNCRYFISNSSCIDYEVKHIIPENRIVRIGKRNKDRSSITDNMTIPNATENIVRILETL